MRWSKIISPNWPAPKNIKVNVITRNFFNNLNEKKSSVVSAKYYLKSNLSTLNIKKKEIYDIKQCHGIKSLQVPPKENASIFLTEFIQNKKV